MDCTQGNNRRKAIGFGFSVHLWANFLFSSMRVTRFSEYIHVYEDWYAILRINPPFFRVQGLQTGKMHVRYVPVRVPHPGVQVSYYRGE